MSNELCELTVEITQSCPNRCLFCSSLALANAQKSLGLSTMRSLAEQASLLGLRDISISGGEPLLHPDLLRIIGAFRDFDINSIIYTTGLARRNDTVVPFLDWELFRIYTPKLVFNVQSAEPTVHDFLAGRPGCLGLTKASLLRAKENGFAVEVHIIPNRVNLDSLEFTVRELFRWGVDRISFLRLVPQGYAKDNLATLRLRSRETRDLYNRFHQLSRAEPSRLRFGIPFSGALDEPKSCNAGLHKLIVRYDGKVLPCEAFKDSSCSRFVLGDIHDESLASLLKKARNCQHLSRLKDSTAPHSEPCPAQALYAPSIGA